jgi:hypothetical protein
MRHNIPLAQGYVDGLRKVVEGLGYDDMDHGRHIACRLYAAMSLNAPGSTSYPLPSIGSNHGLGWA